MSDWSDWYMGKGKAPIAPQVEPTLWEKTRFYVVATLIASVIVLAIFLSTAHAEPVSLMASWYSQGIQ
jgi:hypothetical protein